MKKEMTTLIKLSISFAVIGIIALIGAVGIYIAAAAGAIIEDPWGGIRPLITMFVNSEALAILFYMCEKYRRNPHDKDK